ncbi:MAG: hypothetical protein MI673_06500, partial [Thiotrichales bacterium]|nr:hypothetical protein [Thiotrichales bacterium]
MNNFKLLSSKVFFIVFSMTCGLQVYAISELQGARPQSLYENRSCQQLYLAAARYEGMALN